MAGIRPKKCFLTGAAHPGGPAFRNSISLDQFAAERWARPRDFRSLTLAATGENPTVSVTRSGVAIPPERSPSKLYSQMFVNAKPDEMQQRVNDLRKGRSLLDFVSDSAKDIANAISARPIANGWTNILRRSRDLEQRLVRVEDWEQKPKPDSGDADSRPTSMNRPRFVEKSRVMLDMVSLALTQIRRGSVSFFLDATPIHNLTHHGNRPEIVADFAQSKSRNCRRSTGSSTRWPKPKTARIAA